MAERCPLKNGQNANGKLPDFCLERCQGLMHEATNTQNGVLDWYDDSTEDCDHELYEVVQHHNALIKLNGSADRQYVEVDACEGCLTELLETTYTFTCPHN